MLRLLLLLLFVAAVPVGAQTLPSPPAAAHPDSLLASRLRLADRLLAQRQTGDAVTLLETLDGQRPGHPDVLRRLATAYRTAEMYGAALAVVDRVRLREPSRDLDLRRAELLALTGDTARAAAEWTRLLTDRPTDDDLGRVLPSMALGGRARAAAEGV
jgi:predicted Zn-dependent protease